MVPTLSARSNSIFCVLLVKTQRDGLYQADESLAFHGIEDDSRVQIVGFHMMGKALSWIRGLRRKKLLTTWDRFIDDLWEHFGVADFENKLVDLSQLQKSSTRCSSTVRVRHIIGIVRVAFGGVLSRVGELDPPWIGR